MSIKLAINWTKSVIALALLSTVFCLVAAAQTNTNNSLNQAAVNELLSQLKERLPELIDDKTSLMRSPKSGMRTKTSRIRPNNWCSKYCLPMCGR